MPDKLTSKNWEILLMRIKSKECIPFIGAGASFPHLPLGSSLANTLADEYGYPLSEDNDLARVTQFMAIEYDDSRYPKDIVREKIIARDAPDFKDTTLPHRVLADLDLPIYITTNYDNYMANALTAGNPNKIPNVALCQWNASSEEVERLIDEPTDQKPLVFHLHGHINDASSMVLTEDDYLDFLVNFARDKERLFLPPIVRKGLSKQTLLFIGYSLADWSFRVIFRSIISTLATNQSIKSIAVQLPPSVPKPQSLESAKNYLNKYMVKINRNVPISVYWGTAQEFCQDLKNNLKGN